MAAKPQLTAINIAGKGSSLTSTSIFSIANNLNQVSIDSSLLDKLSSISSSSKTTINHQITFPDFLTLEESRASLTVFLNKFLLSIPSIDVELPNLIAKTLNLYYGVTTLSPVAEMVAALSCEAENAKVTSFNLVDSGDGKCLKDEAGVASDLKALLNGSKLTGKVEVESVSSIPKVYGSFRKVVRVVHSRVRVGLNCGVSGLGKAWGTVLSGLAVVLRDLGEGSLSRVEMNVGCVSNEDLRKSLKSLIDEKCLSRKSLRDGFKVVLDSGFEEMYTLLVHSVNTLFGLVKSVVSWELVTAIVSLEGSDLLERKRGGANDKGDGRVDKKSERRKKVLGKGTGVVLQVIKDRLTGSFVDSGEEFAALEKLAEEIHSLMDPKDPGFGELLEKIKEIVESNESRRLPKIAR